MASSYFMCTILSTSGRLPKLTFRELEQRKDDTEQYLPALKQQIIDDLECDLERQVVAEEGEEPLRGVKVRVQVVLRLSHVWI